MQEQLTNYEGDVEVHCVFCNQPQRKHFVNVGEINGETMLHHWPCKEQIDSLGPVKSPGMRVGPRLLEKLFKAKSGLTHDTRETAPGEKDSRNPDAPPSAERT